MSDRFRKIEYPPGWTPIFSFDSDGNVTDVQTLPVGGNWTVTDTTTANIGKTNSVSRGKSLNITRPSTTPSPTMEQPVVVLQVPYDLTEKASITANPAILAYGDWAANNVDTVYVAGWTYLVENWISYGYYIDTTLYEFHPFTTLSGTCVFYGGGWRWRVSGVYEPDFGALLYSIADFTGNVVVSKIKATFTGQSSIGIKLYADGGSYLGTVTATSETPVTTGVAGGVAYFDIVPSGSGTLAIQSLEIVVG